MSDCLSASQASDVCPSCCPGFARVSRRVALGELDPVGQHNDLRTIAPLVRHGCHRLRSAVNLNDQPPARVTALCSC
jgi:hypothetical protein